MNGWRVTCDPSTWKAETGGLLRLQDQSMLHIVSQNLGRGIAKPCVNSLPPQGLIR